MLRRICVFCGSNNGARPGYAAAAAAVARHLAERGIGIVYGGAKAGLMGQLADTALEAGAEVIGVIPRSLALKEVAHPELTELRVVDTMHERKALMADLADGFLALPGGFGTLDELCEILSWAQLGLHHNPCGVLNVEGFFDPLLEMLDHAVGEGFLRREHRALVLAGASVEELMASFERYQPPAFDQWITRENL